MREQTRKRLIMNSFWQGVTPQSVASASYGFPQFEVGENEAFINQVNPATSKNSGRKMLDIIFKKMDGAEIHYYIVDDEYKLGKLKHLQEAFNIPFGNSEIDTTWKNKRGIVVCKEGKPKDNGKTYPEVSFLKAIRKTNHDTEQRQAASDSFHDDIPF